jgi:hypothetical protein
MPTEKSALEKGYFTFPASIEGCRYGGHILYSEY